jgi:hypothetical protein
MAEAAHLEIDTAPTELVQINSPCTTGEPDLDPLAVLPDDDPSADGAICGDAVDTKPKSAPEMICGSGWTVLGWAQRTPPANAITRMIDTPIHFAICDYDTLARMKTAVMFTAVLAFAGAAAAQNADDYRGGWRTDSGQPHTLELSIRDNKVRGIYCTWCADATTLAFVDGTFGASGLTFEVVHVKADGSTAYKDKATAKFRERYASADRHERARWRQVRDTMIKDPRGPDRCRSSSRRFRRSSSGPRSSARRSARWRWWRRAARLHPAGPVKSKLTEKDVLGVWLGFGVGAPKQMLIRMGNALRGWSAACDNPYTMAALDDVEPGRLAEVQPAARGLADGER